MRERKPILSIKTAPPEQLEAEQLKRLVAKHRTAKRQTEEAEA